METDNVSSLNTSVFNSKLHDVEIKHVEIVNPFSTSVKFQVGFHENECVSQKATSSLDGEDYDVRALKETPENDFNVKQKPTVQFSEDTTSHDVSGLEITSCPLQSNLFTVADRKGNENNNLCKVAKQKLKEELFHKQQQFYESVGQNERHCSVRKMDSSTKLYEVAPGVMVPERPLSRTPADFIVTEQVRTGPFVTSYQNRAATVPDARKVRVWTGHRSVASSRAISSVSSRWRMEELAQPRPNMFIKMPFKQVPVVTMDSKTKMKEDEIILLPGEDLRATTAFALSRIRHAFRRMSPPSNNSSKQGRLLKSRLVPLEPVKINGPRISTCRGIQPEARKEVTDSPPPSQLRELKEQYLKMCQVRNHALVREEYKRRKNAHSAASDQSIHRTSPQPNVDNNQLYSLSVYPNQGFSCVKKRNIHEDITPNRSKYSDIPNQAASVDINSQVIY